MVMLPFGAGAVIKRMLAVLRNGLKIEKVGNFILIAYQDGGPSSVKASPRTPILYLSINILDIGGMTHHRKHPEPAEQTPQLHMLKGLFLTPTTVP
jgi:hypothetical protein